MFNSVGVGEGTPDTGRGGKRKLNVALNTFCDKKAEQARSLQRIGKSDPKDWYHKTRRTIPWESKRGNNGGHTRSGPQGIYMH